MELWDVYDIHRQKKGYRLARCTPEQLPDGCDCRAALAPNGKLNLKPDEYHLSVHIWLINARGELLIQKRAENKLHMPGVWAACGGAVMADEDSISAAVRETYEEMGIRLEPSKLFRLLTYTLPERNSHMDVYLYRHDCDPSALTLQTEEVSRVAWFSLDELTGKTLTDEQFRRYNYMDVLYDFIKTQADWRRRGFACGEDDGSGDELLDLYDMRGERTGRSMRRHGTQAYGEYLYAANIWFITSDGRALLQRRSMKCKYKPGYFAPAGGMVRSGEDGMAAARREAFEELGLKLDEKKVFRLCEFVGRYQLCTVYVANQDLSSGELSLKKDEVSAVEFVNADMLSAFSQSDNFLSPPYLPMVTGTMRAIEKLGRM